MPDLKVTADHLRRDACLYIRSLFQERILRSRCRHGQSVPATFHNLAKISFGPIRPEVEADEVGEVDEPDPLAQEFAEIDAVLARSFVEDPQRRRRSSEPAAAGRAAGPDL